MIVADLTDEELTQALHQMAQAEAESTADVLEHLEEFDKRRLSDKKGYPALFIYCTRVLGYSEGAAAKRIRAARVCRDFPIALELLRRRRLHLAAISLLAPVLKPENHVSLLARAQGKSKREIERIVAECAPRETSLDVVRREARLTAAEAPEAPTLPMVDGACLNDHPSVSGSARQSPGTTDNLFSPDHSIARPDRIEPISPQRFRIAFSASDEFQAKLEQVRALLRHKYPQGQLEALFDEALDAFLSLNDPLRPFGAPSRAYKAGSRRIPRWIRYQVWKRDGGRCSFRAPDGHRCEAEERLEFDHM